MYWKLTVSSFTAELIGYDMARKAAREALQQAGEGLTHGSGVVLAITAVLLNCRGWCG